MHLAWQTLAYLERVAGAVVAGDDVAARLVLDALRDERTAERDLEVVAVDAVVVREQPDDANVWRAGGVLRREARRHHQRAGRVDGRPVLAAVDGLDDLGRGPVRRAASRR